MLNVEIVYKNSFITFAFIELLEYCISLYLKTKYSTFKIICK